MKLSCRQILALDDDCRLLRSAAVAACNSEGWPLQSTMSTATETRGAGTGAGGRNLFHWVRNLLSYWHSESYIRIIKQLSHHSLVSSSPTAHLSYTLHFFPRLFKFTGKNTESTKDKRRRHQTTTKGQIYRNWKDAQPPLLLQLLFSWFRRTQWTPTPDRSRSDTAPVDKHTTG